MTARYDIASDRWHIVAEFEGPIWEALARLAHERGDRPGELVNDLVRQALLDRAGARRVA